MLRPVKTSKEIAIILTKTPHDKDERHGFLFTLLKNKNISQVINTQHLA
jgi:hypothetical protein